jgi:hypothetical protein
MANSKHKTFDFSALFLKAEYIENIEDYYIGEKTIVINAGGADIPIADKSLKPWNSSIYSSIIIPKAQKVIFISPETNFFSCSPFPHFKEITEKWNHIHNILPLPQLKDVKLWRSKKDRIDNIEFNLWYATAGTKCGIHNEHDFREVHTQVYGIGRMQKFHKNERNSIYQEVFMSPGYTHEPFYNEDHTYPWHQYKADTDCIWLAIEFHSE